MDAFYKSLTAFCSRSESQIDHSPHGEFLGGLFDDTGTKGTSPLGLRGLPSPLDYTVLLNHLPESERVFIDAFTVAWGAVDDKKELFAAITNSLRDHYKCLSVLDRLLFACFYAIKNQIFVVSADANHSNRSVNTPQSISFMSPGPLHPSSPLPGTTGGTPSMARMSSISTPISNPLMSPTLSSTRVLSSQYHSPDRAKFDHFSEFSQSLVGLLSVSQPLLWLAILNFVTHTIEYLAHKSIEYADKYLFVTPLQCPGIVEKGLVEINLHLSRLPLVPLDADMIHVFLSTVDLILGGRPSSRFTTTGSGNSSSVRPFPTVSHYELMLITQRVFDSYPHTPIHWCLLPLTTQARSRRQRLAQCFLPTDAAQPPVAGLPRTLETTFLSTHPGSQLFIPEIRNYIQQDAAASVSSVLWNLLQQREHVQRIQQLLETGFRDPAQARRLLHKAVFRRIHQTAEYIRQHSNFDDLQPHYLENLLVERVYINMPERLTLWPLMTELGEQVLALAQANLIDFPTLFEEIYRYLFPNDRDAPSVRTCPTFRRGVRDNTYLWILLPLFYIEDERSPSLREDFSHNEDYLAKMSHMYNDHQAVSVDAFFLRDMALQCMVMHQQTHISDSSNLKYRHPALDGAMPHFRVVAELQRIVAGYLSEPCRAGPPEMFTFLSQLSEEESVRFALLYYMRQAFIQSILWPVILPQLAQPELETACFPQMQYQKCGRISQRLLEFLPPSVNDQTLTMLNRVVLERCRNPDNSENQCASPWVLDLMYRLALLLPTSSAALVSEWLRQLGLLDVRIKVAAAQSAASGYTHPGVKSPTDIHTVWLYTLVQLLGYRFVGALRDQMLHYQFLGYIRSITNHSCHRQLHLAVETLTIHLMGIQADKRFIQWLATPSDLTPQSTAPPSGGNWFAANDMLARRLVMTLARLLKNHQFGSTLSRGALYALLDRCGNGPRMVWSRNTLAYFPAVLRRYYVEGYQNVQRASNSSADPASAPTAESAQHPPRPSTPTNLSTSPTEEQVNHLISENDIHNVLLPGGADSTGDQALSKFYASVDKQPLFLCVLWYIAEVQKEITASMMPHVRRIMLLFPPAHLTSYTTALIDFILEKKSEDSPSNLPGLLLEEFVWTHQILSFDHVIFALLRGHQGPLAGAKARRILRYLLFESPALQRRLAHWRSLGFVGRPWVDLQHYERIRQYLLEFPEFFDYETFRVSSYTEMSHMAPLQPPHTRPLPIIYETSVLRLVNQVDYLLARCIELEDRELLLELLTGFGDLVRTHHPTPLKMVQSLLNYYYDSPVLRDQRILRALVSLLDPAQYYFSPEFSQLFVAEPAPGGPEVLSVVSAPWSVRLLERGAALTEPLGCAVELHDQLPPAHFREYVNPRMFALQQLAVEVMVFSLAVEEHTGSVANPLPGSKPGAPYGQNPVLLFLMDTLARPSTIRLPTTLTPAGLLHLAGALFALLPAHAYTRPMVGALIHLVKSPQGDNLTEPSPVCLLSSLVGPALRSRSSRGGSESDEGGADLDSTPLTLEGGSYPPQVAFVLNPFHINHTHFTGNTPNALLTLFHSLAAYGDLEVFHFLHLALRSARSAATAALAHTVHFAFITTPHNVPPAGHLATLVAPQSASGFGQHEISGHPAVMRSSFGAVATPHTPSAAIPATPGRILKSLAPSPATGTLSSSASASYLQTVGTPTPLRGLTLLPGQPLQRPLSGSDIKIEQRTLPPPTVATFDTFDELGSPNTQPHLDGHDHFEATAAVFEGSAQATLHHSSLHVDQVIGPNHDHGGSGNTGGGGSSSGSGGGGPPLTSDTQLLYLLLVVGPHLHRLDHEPVLFQAILGDLLWLLVEVHHHLHLYGQRSTVAAETVLDFFYHARGNFHTDKPVLWRDLEAIVVYLRDPLRSRLMPICADRKL
ncbi:mediator complex subunit 23-domain-containing protein [Dimargaris cristalligena]|uniref:Mediator complex subunit 23-domain-containing protein n=1 Tax=Dimargaris cristalligena TaxID=215637 RepID=A0A4P9ZM59_9FUNG|nr:mediator complex subunit 23-domain-containing protein [Dimargaris cristalligena]|eukprot:RKP34208.1 mediator complex subunit 23-domain-containing protein [Dimargaris cristalligena]